MEEIGTTNPKPAIVSLMAPFVCMPTQITKTNGSLRKLAMFTPGSN